MAGGKKWSWIDRAKPQEKVRMAEIAAGLTESYKNSVAIPLGEVWKCEVERGSRGYACALYVDGICEDRGAFVRCKVCGNGVSTNNNSTMCHIYFWVLRSRDRYICRCCSI
jgi:hypothetical protein